MVFSPNDKFIASGSQDKSAKVGENYLVLPRSHAGREEMQWKIFV